jgi:hypothetical protein
LDGPVELQMTKYLSEIEATFGKKIIIDEIITFPDLPGRKFRLVEINEKDT